MDLSKESYERIVADLHDGLYLVDRNRVIRFWNRAAEKISGFTAEEVVGHGCFDSILTHIDHDGNSLCTAGCPLAATIADGKPREAEVYLRHKNGHRIPVSVRTSPLTDDSGRIIGGIELFTDISNQRVNLLRIRELEKMALLDGLTELANRYFIEREIRNRLEEKKRFKTPFGILFIDVDHFKRINDTFGHPAGDKVLRMIARTFAVNSRPFDLFGRWGGEEFVGVIRNVDREKLQRIGQRIRALIDRAYLVHEDRKINVTVSIGATVAGAQDTLESIVKRADMMMYQSKSSGRNRLMID